MDKTTPIVVRFSREGDPQVRIPLTRTQEYRITVDNGAWETFKSPWNQEQLDKHIKYLGNREKGDAPHIEELNAIGKALGKRLGRVKSFTRALDRSAGKSRCIIWILGWPELANIPWELTTRWTSPFKHILLEDKTTFVRAVPANEHTMWTRWPTGRESRLRLLFAWSDPFGDVPHKKHRKALEKSCQKNDVEFVEQEVKNISDIERRCENSNFDFVHILAHGAETKSGRSGLLFEEGTVKGEQLAQALKSTDWTPSLVTLAACDSGAEPEGGYGSVAYELHVLGIPMVRASLFRLRMDVSKFTVGPVYRALLAGDHPLNVLSSVRRRLASRDDESWANEMIYLRYFTDTLDEAAAVGRQQGVLRRARVIEGKYAQPLTDIRERLLAIEKLEGQIDRLRPLVEQKFDLPETYGLLGSLTRRIAYLRRASPSREGLRDAREYYEKGFRSNEISHYPGIDAIHLSLLLGDENRARQLTHVVRFALENEIRKRTPDYWAFASAGELEVYDGDREEALRFYRQFIRRQREALTDHGKRHDEIEAALGQLQKFQAQFAKQTHDKKKGIVGALSATIKYLKRELSRTHKEKQGKPAHKPTAKKGPPKRAKTKQRRMQARNIESKSKEQVYDVHMLPARLGDALWIEYGDAFRPHRVLIDGGKADTAAVIKRRILSVVKKEGQCRLELLVISHIDADHIEGILKLLGDASLKGKLIIDDIWFNGEHHLPKPGSKNEKRPRFLGARQGEFLSALIKRRGFKWNHRPWHGKSIYVPKSDPLPRFTLDGGLEIILLSPTYETMLNLSTKWKAELIKAGLDHATDAEMLKALGGDKRLAPDAEFLSADGRLLSVDPKLVRKLTAAKVRRDTSPANGSSIAFLATYNDRHCLFAGDAYSGVLQQNIDRLLIERHEKSLKLGAFKVPHHGSRANLHEGLLKRLDCQHFLVSTNGDQFQHPDREAIAHIINGAWRPNRNMAVEIHFNYHTKYNKTWNKPALKREFNYRVEFPRSKSGGLKFSVP